MNDIPEIEIPNSVSSDISETVVASVSDTPIKTATVQIDRETSGDPIEDQLPLIIMPADTMERVKDFAAKADAHQPDEKWVDALKRGMDLTYVGGELDTLSEEQNTLWRQSLKAGDNELSAAKPKFSDNHTTNLTGEAALLRVRDLTGMGSTIQIPLYHSGIWVSLKAPSDGDLLELERRAAEIKVSLGRQTRGRIFSNITVALSGIVVDFALAHIYRTTVKPEEVEKAGGLRNLILQQDIPTLLWGLVLLIYPGGFNYSRSLISNAREEVITRKLNIGRLQCVNNRAFSDKQLRHIARRFDSSMTVTELENYRSEFIELSPKEVKITDAIRIVFSPSNITKHLEDGQYWINSIVARADTILSFQQNSPERDQYLISQGKASVTCQYTHIVNKIIVGENQVINDKETIHNALATLSGNDTFYNNFFTEVAKYLRSTVVSIIALDTLSKEEDERAEQENPNFPHLIPLDMIQTFFTLLVLTTDRIRARD